VLQRLGGHPFTCEYKYDGERAQVSFLIHTFSVHNLPSSKSFPFQLHREKSGRITIYSRKCEEHTSRYPDVIETLEKVCCCILSFPPSLFLEPLKFRCKKSATEAVEDYILDGEIVAMDPETGKIREFQLLTTRARKVNWICLSFLFINLSLFTQKVELESIKVRVCFYAFDMLYLNGQVSLHVCVTV